MSFGSSADESFDNDSEIRCFRRELFNAVERNNYENLQSLLKNNKYDAREFINIKDASNNSNTLLHVALKSRKRKLDFENNNKIIKLLVEKGADTETANDLGETPQQLFKKRLKNGTTLNGMSISISSQASHSSALEVQICNSFGIKSETLAQQYSEIYKKADTQRALLEKNPVYESSGLKLSLHGVLYQLQLLMLFLHRATKSFHSFYLATELNEAAKFDDVVLMYKVKESDQRWTCRFLQAKHVLSVSSSKIRKNQLFSLSDKLPFSLHKYLDSFWKIKHNDFFSNSDFEDFVICTNAEFGTDAEQYFVRENSLKKDKILHFNKSKITKYKLRNNTKQLLYNNWRSRNRQYLTDNCLNEFLEKFRFITGFPNKDELNKLISIGMGEEFRLLNTDLVTNSFKSNILDWMASYKGGKSHYLIIDNGKYFIKSIKHQIRVLMTSGLSVSNQMKLQGYNISFNAYPEALFALFRENSIQLVHLVTESPLLSSLKVADFIRANKQSQRNDEIIFLSTKQLQIGSTRNLALKSFSHNNCPNLLIVYCDDIENMNTEMTNKLISIKLLEILKNNVLKKVVFVAPSRYNLALFSACGIPCRRQEDQTNFGDLADISQLSVLKKEVTFQGKNIILSNMINIHSAIKFLTEDVLEFIIQGNEINIGSVDSKHFDTSIRTQYIDRNVSRRMIRSNILQDKQFLGSNIILLVIEREMDIIQLQIDYKLLKHNVEESHKNGIIAYTKDSSGVTLFETYESLCRKYPAVDIFQIQFQNNGLTLEKFRGNIHALANYYADNSEQDYLQEEEFSYLRTADTKYNILAGNPGMGKTLFLEKLSFNLKDKNPDLWVLKLSLNDLVCHKRVSKLKSLEDITFSAGAVDEAINFILDVTLPGDMFGKSCNIQRKLLLLTLKRESPLFKFPRVAILFDGFDEICPMYKERTITLLKALKQCNISKMWITTRTHEQIVLQQELGTPAYYLNPLCKEQKIHYLRKAFHESASSVTDNHYISNDHLSIVCKYFSEITLESEKPSLISAYSIISPESSLKRQIDHVMRSDFTDNPLHCRMLAEVLSTKHEDSNFNLDLSQLYKEFIDIKFDKYYKEVTHMSNAVAAMEMRMRDYRNMKVLHQELAINEIFPNTCEITQNRFNMQELIRVGFIVQPRDGFISFIHRSFAEYFGSNFIAEHFDNEVIQNILSESMFWEDAFMAIRVFLNRNMEFLRKLEGGSHNILQNILNRRPVTVLLLNLLNERCEEIIKSIMKHANNFCPNILQAVKGNILTHSYLINFTEDKRKLATLLDIILFDSNIFDALYHHVDRKGEFSLNFHSFTTLHKWICCYSGDNSQLLLDAIFRVEINKQGYEMSDDPKAYANKCLNLLVKLLNTTYASLSVLHLAAIEGKLNLITELLLWLKKDMIKSITCTKFSDESTVKRIQNIIYNLLFMVDEQGRTFLHFATDNNKLNDFLSLVQCYFGQGTLRDLISRTDSSGQTLFHHLVGSNKECAQTIEIYLIYLRDHLDKEDMKNILLKVDKEGKTAFHNVAILADCNTSLQILLNYLTLDFDVDTITKLLLMSDTNEKTVLIYSLTDSDALTTLLGYCEKHFDKAFLETIFSFRDFYKQNIIHHCVQRCNRGKAVEILLIFIKKHFGKYRLEKMLFEKDFYEQIAFHYACESKSEIIDSLLNFVCQEYGPSATKKLIFTEDSSGRTCIHFAANTILYDRNQIRTLVGFLKIHYDLKSFHQAVFKTDFHYRTLLHYAQMAIGGLSVDKILNCLKENCDKVILLKYMVALDKDGKTALQINFSKASHKSFMNAYTSLIEALPEYAGNIYDKATLLSIDDINLLKSELFGNHYVGEDMCNRLFEILDDYTRKNYSTLR